MLTFLGLACYVVWNVYLSLNCEGKPSETHHVLFYVKWYIANIMVCCCIHHAQNYIFE